MTHQWETAAERAVAGLGMAPGELVLVRDHACRIDVLQEMLLAIERRGATPLPEILTAEYLGRLLRAVPEAHLAAWDRRRQDWPRQADRILVLEGEPLGFAFDLADPAASAAWGNAAGRLEAIEEARRLPYLLVTMPTERQAERLGIPLAELETTVLPALTVDAAELRREIDRVIAAAHGTTMVIHSGAGCELQLVLGDRLWLADDGVIGEDDRARGAIVSNLPAGSVYTTVLEERTTGTLHLPQADEASEVILRFADGEIVEITAASGAASLQAMFDRETGDARRIGHVGIGLNPVLQQRLGWPLVDEHVRGCLFVSLGENRYMGGQNASSLNVDYVVSAATLAVDGRVIVREGGVVV